MAARPTSPNPYMIPQDRFVEENMSPLQLRATHQMMDMLSALEKYDLAPYVQSVRSYDRNDWTSGGIVDIVPHMEAYWAIKHFMHLLKDIDLSGDVQEAKYYDIMFTCYDQCKTIIQPRGQPVLYTLNDVGNKIANDEIFTLIPTLVTEDTPACHLVSTPNQVTDRRMNSTARLRSITEDVVVTQSRPESMEQESRNVSPVPRAEDSDSEWENPDQNDDSDRDDQNSMQSLANRLVQLNQEYQNTTLIKPLCR